MICASTNPHAFTCEERPPEPDARGIYPSGRMFGPPPFRWAECEPQPRESYT
jgi:hypothetical protein